MCDVADDAYAAWCGTVPACSCLAMAPSRCAVNSQHTTDAGMLYALDDVSSGVTALVTVAVVTLNSALIVAFVVTITKQLRARLRQTALGRRAGGALRERMTSTRQRAASVNSKALAMTKLVLRPSSRRLATSAGQDVAADAAAAGVQLEAAAAGAGTAAAASVSAAAAATARPEPGPLSAPRSRPPTRTRRPSKPKTPPKQSEGVRPS